MRHNCNDLTYYAKSTTLLEDLIHLGVLLPLVISLFRADYDQKAGASASPEAPGGLEQHRKAIKICRESSVQMGLYLHFLPTLETKDGSILVCLF